MSLQTVNVSEPEFLNGFLTDPPTLFEHSYTAVQTMPRERMLEAQIAGLVRRFEHQVEAIPMLAKLAGRQGIDSLDDLNDIVPLLFEHTMYKSYPMALLERQQFGRLTGWLDKLTSTDLSGFDARGCDSIDQWLQRIYDQTPLDLAYTSGTTGTVSFIPWTKTELIRRAELHRMGQLQQVGIDATQVQLSAPYHHIASPQRHRTDYLAAAFTCGDLAYWHPRTTRRADADLLWMAARLRMATARGDSSRIEVPENLLARRAELEEIERTRDERDQVWLDEILALQGSRVMWMGFPFDVYTIVKARTDAGERLTFDDDSVVVLVGGNKGNVLPSGWLDTIRTFTDARVTYGYGMTELSTMSYRCSSDRYHLQPWVIPYVLDPDTSTALPRTGRQTGRFGFFDLLPESHWGGLLTGDEVEVDFDGTCDCGASTQHLSPEISRLSERRGGDDKITCAATPEAYAEAMSFLTGM